MKKLFLYLFLYGICFGAVITGDQTKVNIVGGSAFVESNGAIKTMNSGEIIYISENKAPSDAKKFDRKDMTSLNNGLNPSDDSDVINIIYPEVTFAIAEKIKKQLMSQNIDPKRIAITEKLNTIAQITISKIDKELVKKIYPLYYETASNFYLQKSNKGLIPTLKMQKRHLYFYHKSVFNLYKMYDYGKEEEKENKYKQSDYK